MEFTVNSLTRCAGQNHYVVTVTLESAVVRTFNVLKDEVFDSPTPDEVRDRGIVRLRSAIKEAAAVTFAQAQAAIVGNTYRV